MTLLQPLRIGVPLKLWGSFPMTNYPICIERRTLYPSLYEGFGLPLLEAMACGCPVISSTRGSLDEMVGEAALKIDPEDVDQMAFQLSRMAADQVLRSRLQVAGIAQAKQYDWGRTAAGTMRVYEQTVNEAAIPAGQSQKAGLFSVAR